MHIISDYFSNSIFWYLVVGADIAQKQAYF